MIVSLYYVSEPSKLVITKKNLIVIMYATIVTTVLGYVVRAWANSKISSSLVSATTPLRLLASVILSYFVLNEMLSPMEIGGGLVVLFALVLVVWSNYHEEKKAQAAIEENVLKS